MSKYKDQIKVWGRAPTPLVPKEFIRNIGNIEVPELSVELGIHVHLAYLNGEIWDSRDTLARRHLSQIVKFIKNHKSAVKKVALRSSPSIVELLQELPLSRVTCRILRNHADMLGADIVRFSELMTVPGCGIRQAVEIACLLEQAGKVQIEEIMLTVQPDADVADDTPTYEIAFAEIEYVIQSLAAWGYGKQQFETLGCVLPPASTIWPRELQRQWNTIRKLNNALVGGKEIEQYTAPGMISKFVDDLDDRWFEILMARGLPVKVRKTLSEIGKRLDLSQERTRQIQSKALLRVREIIEEPHSPLNQRAALLRNRLGSAVPLNGPALQRNFDFVLKDFAHLEKRKILFAQELLLRFAGPYKQLKNWLVTDSSIFSSIEELLNENRRSDGFISNQAVNNALVRNRVRLEHKKQLLELLGEFLPVEDGVIPFGGSLMDKAYAIMNYDNRVFSVEELLAIIGSDSAKSVTHRLMEDPRFWRINKQNDFVLAHTPGYEQYTSIVDKIDSMLEKNSGQAPFHEIVNEISSNFGVKQQSVIAYLNSSRFATDAVGIVKFRKQQEFSRKKFSMNDEVDCFCTRSGRWVWRVQVDRNLLRGSGRPFPDAFAVYLGCRRGKSIQVSTDLGPLTLSWSQHSLVGATVGSLRKVALAYEAQVGDYIFVIAMDGRLKYEILQKSALEKADSDLIRAALMIRCEHVKDDDEAVAELAYCFAIPYRTHQQSLSELRYLLHQRKEKALLEAARELAIEFEQPQLPLPRKEQSAAGSERGQTDSGTKPHTPS